MTQRVTKRSRTRRAAVVVVCALWATACADRESGEVTLVVSTDLSLPADLSWLEWSVTPLSHPERTQTGGLALEGYDSLPATLAVISGKERAEAVSVRVLGRSGERGPVRVEREAQFTLPEYGQQMLNMPLSWLCSDVNQPEPCGAGQTCDAGRCVPSDKVTLLDHVASQSSACFDVLKCTLTARSIRQTPDLEGDSCILEPRAVLGSAINVALIINTDKAGNAGVCAPASSAEGSPPSAGNCLVPLAEKSGPSGWDLVRDAQGQTVIRLPRAVCDPHVLNSIAGVAVTEQDGCRSKRSIEPSCAAPSTCVPGSCPDGLPSTWSGYSCSGTASPMDDSSLGLSYCGLSDGDPQLGATIPGHFCCTKGQAPAEDPLLIDDMSGGPLIKFPAPEGQLPGSWFTSSDDKTRPLSPPQAASSLAAPSLFTYRDIVPAVALPGGPKITRAACFRMDQGFSGTYALEGFSFYGLGAEATALDVSHFSGIRFWAKLDSFDPDIPQPIRVVFPNLDTDTEHPASSCLSAGLRKSNCDHFGKLLSELKPTWQKFEVRWGDLTQSLHQNQQPFSHFDTHVYTVDFQAVGPGPDAKTLSFDFCASQISFFK
jgi:hypothetical protein